MSNIKKVLIIAGSDSSGGAGLQADIKTVQEFNLFSSNVITSLTAQNTEKVAEIHTPPISFFEKQLNTVLDDIKFDIIKIGMLANEKIIASVVKILEEKSPKTPIVLDPVMVATSGDKLLEDKAIKLLKEKLIPNSFMVTPNIAEAEILSGVSISNVSDMEKAAKKIKDLGVNNVLIKGGHLEFPDKKIRSLLLDEYDEPYIIINKQIGKRSIHGTGCTLASAIACNIVNNLDILSACKKSNDYVYRLIKDAKKVGNGSLVLK